MWSRNQLLKLCKWKLGKWIICYLNFMKKPRESTEACFHKHGFSCIRMFSYFKKNWEDQTRNTLLFRENPMGFERQQKSQKYCGSRLVLTCTFRRCQNLSSFLSVASLKRCVVKFHLLVVADVLVSPTKCSGKTLFKKHNFVREKKIFHTALNSEIISNKNKINK